MAAPVFRSLGGTFQLVIEDEGALGRIHELDPARWAITSFPTYEFTGDPAFLEYIDPKKKGRILVDQLIGARDWLFRHLKGRSRLAERTDRLALADIDASHDDGSAIRKAAERILAELESADREGVTLAQVRTYRNNFKKRLANGDGIVCPEVLPEPDVAALVKAMVGTVGSKPDASGHAGVDTALVDKFIAQGGAYLEWKAKGRTANGAEDPTIFVWGSDTPAASALVAELDAKLAQYFSQCDLVRQEPALAERFRISKEQLEKFEVGDTAAITKYLKDAPISQPNASGELVLTAEINPYYRKAWESLKSGVLARALGAGSTSLTRDTWKAVAGLFSPYQTWQSAKPPEPFDTLAEAELKGHLESPLMQRVRHFIAADAAAAPEIAQLANVEKLILYQRYLLELANNFVSLSALYDPKVLTLFEEGAIVIDGRRLEFAMRVVDRPGHKKVATESRIFLVYAAISEVDGKTLFEVAAPVTRGLKGRLVAGKRGVFLARDGRVLDAQILEVVEHPISVPEAIRAPFERTARFISQKVEEFAASRQSAAEASMQASVVQAGTAAATASTAPGAAGAAPKGKMEPSQMAGILAGGGLAIAAVGSSLAFIVSSLAKITLIDALKVVLSIVGLVIVISAFVGWLKLRLRDLGPFLEAAGFATNPKMKVNGRLSRIFNRRPGLIRDHVKDLKPSVLVVIDDEDDDATFEKWFTISIIIIVLFIIVVTAVAWYQGLPVVEVFRGLGGSGGS